MNRSTQIKVRQLGIIMISWLLVGVFIAVYDHLVLLTAQSKGISSQYSFLSALIQQLLSAAIGAVIGGSFLVFYINVRFSNKPYSYTIAAVTVSFALVIAIIITVKIILFAPQGSVSLHPFFSDSSRVKNILIWFVVVAFTQLLLQVSSKMGQAGLANVLSGKYNTPQAEKRIFMFLDLDASTTMAEKLGDALYHQLLRDFFADVADPILNNKGEVYQYVGDEVVVAWNHDEGIAGNRCIQCYFDILDNIRKNAGKYQQRYGCVPAFRAGIHSGEVVAGEVGIAKREVTYSGDVLNTTSRILGKAKEMGAGIISSSTLLRELTFDQQFTTRLIGTMRLRGKEQEVCLTEILLTPSLVRPA